MRYLNTDQYTHVGNGCPVAIDLHRADHCVEIAIGGNDDTVRLTFHDPDVMCAIATALHTGHDQLVAHLEAALPSTDSDTDEPLDLVSPTH
jgi:hypothetical protein